MESKVWTADELSAMAPAEQDAIFRAGIVRDLNDVPDEFLARVRARFEERLAAQEIPNAS